MSERILIRGGCVLTLGARTPNLPVGDVLIEDGRVVEVGPRVRARNAEVVEAADRIVMPGFVDTHRHAWKSLLRNLELAEAGSPEYAARYTPDDVYTATLVSLLGAAEAGITTAVDWSDIQAGEDHTRAALQAHADAGLRTVLVHVTPTWARGLDGGSALRQLASSPAPSPPAISLAFGPAEPVGLRDESGEDWRMARELGLRIHAHTGPTPATAGSVSDLASKGLLGGDVTLVHCSHLDEQDLEAIASSGAGVSLTPVSEMAGSMGTPPVQRLIDRGIRPGLGVDDEQIAPGDLFAQMRATQSIQHATFFDLKLAGKAGLPNLLTTREVIRYATVDGARVAGLGDLTGSIEPGKLADVVVLRSDRPNIFPINDPIGAVVWGMDTSNVEWVFVGGRVVVRDGALVADTAELRRAAAEARGRITEAVRPSVGTDAVEAR